MAHSATEIFLQVQNGLGEQMLLSNELRAQRVITLGRSLGGRLTEEPRTPTFAFQPAQPFEGGRWVQTVSELVGI